MRSGLRTSTSEAPAPAGLADLSPGYFALVMATGIVSVAAHLHGQETVAIALY
jgi:hypothetical protein